MPCFKKQISAPINDETSKAKNSYYSTVSPLGAYNQPGDDVTLKENYDSINEVNYSVERLNSTEVNYYNKLKQENMTELTPKYQNVVIPIELFNEINIMLNNIDDNFFYACVKKISQSFSTK